MSKKKTPQRQSLSSVQFLKQEVRKLPIGTCFITSDIEEKGEGIIVVVRNYVNEKVCFGIYLVDMYCMGLKSSIYGVDYSKEAFYDLLYRHDRMQDCTYEEAHNRIYGAIAFAEEAGINPHSSFGLTRYLLEEDTEAVPLVEYEYGKGGKHFLVCRSKTELGKYLPKLKKNLGDDYGYEITDRAELELIPSADVYMERLKNFGEGRNQNFCPSIEYTYKHPQYPQKFHIDLPEWFLFGLNNPNSSFPAKEFVDQLFELPKDFVCQALEQVIWVRMGQTCDVILDDDEDYKSLSNAVILLGEFGNSESSLDVLLEVMRQSGDFMDFHFGDISPEVVSPTLYLLGKNRLDKLKSYMKEEGLYEFFKSSVFDAVVQVAVLNTERRSDVIEWFRDMMHFAVENILEAKSFDSSLAGMMMNSLIDFQASELLPEIKSLFDAHLVDENACGDFASLNRYITNPSHEKKPSDYETNVYNRIKELKDRWEQ